MSENTAQIPNTQHPQWQAEAQATGLRVFPVTINWNGQKWDKRPLIKDWVNLASAESSAIDAMPWHGANGYGIATGRDVFVLDDDGYKEGSQADEWLAAHGLTGPTRTHRTVSGGTHRIYRLPPTVSLRNRAGIVTGLDARGDGGFIAFGEGYEVIDASPPALLDAAICAELDRPAVTVPEQDDADFTAAPLDPVLIAKVEALKTSDSGFAAALCGPVEDRSKALGQCARVMKRADFTSHEYVTVIMELSEGPRGHVEDQGRKALRALKRFWGMAGQSRSEIFASMPSFDSLTLPEGARPITDAPAYSDFEAADRMLVEDRNGMAIPNIANVVT